MAIDVIKTAPKFSRMKKNQLSCAWDCR